MKMNHFAFLVITASCFLTRGALCNGLYGDGNTTYSELVVQLDLDASDENDQPSTPILSPGEYVIAFGKKEDGYKYTASSGWPATNMAMFWGWQIGFTYKIGDGDWISYRSPGNPPNNSGVYATEMEAYNSYTPISLRLDRAEALTFKVGDTPGHYSDNRGGRSILVYRVSEKPKSWLWFGNYPWVYSHEEQDWLYFYPSGSMLRYWSNRDQAWRQFN